jgi:hypothetical protein
MKWAVGTTAALTFGVCVAAACEPSVSGDSSSAADGGAASRAGQGGAGATGLAGQAGGDEGSAGRLETPAVTCEDSSADRLVGVPVDSARGCLLSDAPPRVVACAGPDNAVPSGIYGSSCVRYVQTGQEFWLTAPWERLLAPGWEACSDVPADPPPPCFARSCPENDLGQRAFPESV